MRHRWKIKLDETHSTNKKYFWMKHRWKIKLDEIPSTIKKIFWMRYIRQIKIVMRQWWNIKSDEIPFENEKSTKTWKWPQKLKIDRQTPKVTNLTPIWTKSRVSDPDLDQKRGGIPETRSDPKNGQVLVKMRVYYIVPPNCVLRILTSKLVQVFTISTRTRAHEKWIRLWFYKGVVVLRKTSFFYENKGLPHENRCFGQNRPI